VERRVRSGPLASQTLGMKEDPTAVETALGPRLDNAESNAADVKESLSKIQEQNTKKK